MNDWDRRNTRGGTPSYKLYRYLPPHRVGILRRLGLKTSIDFAHFGLESGMVFEGTTGVYERIYRFNCKWVRKKEKYANSKIETNLRIFFCLRSNLSNTNIRLGLKTGLENDIFRSEIGSGLGEPGGTPPPRISRSTPRGKTEQKVLFWAMC